jgi:predicted DNA binding protein
MPTCKHKITTKSKKTTIPLKKVNCGQKGEVELDWQKLKVLTAQQKQIKAQILAIWKKADKPVVQDEFCTRRRNVLFVDFAEYATKMNQKEGYSISNGLYADPYKGFDSEHDSVVYFDDDETIDNAIARMDSIINVANDFKKRLQEAQDHGCERLIDKNYCSETDFEFQDLEDDN